MATNFDIIREMCVKRFCGTTSGVIYSGTHRIFIATSNQQYDFGNNARLLPTSTVNSGSSVYVYAQGTFGTTGTYTAWNLNMWSQVVFNNVAWATNVWLYSASTTGTIGAIWKIGFGTDSGAYVNWSSFGTYLSKQFQFALNAGGSRFVQPWGARVFDFQSTNFINATRSFLNYDATTWVATLVVGGVNTASRINPNAVVLYGSIEGTAGAYGANPIATFLQFFHDPRLTATYDPANRATNGGGWESVEINAPYIATFFFRF